MQLRETIVALGVGGNERVGMCFKGFGNVFRSIYNSVITVLMSSCNLINIC